MYQMTARILLRGLTGLGLCLTLSLAGCGSNENEKENAQTAAPGIPSEHPDDSFAQRRERQKAAAPKVEKGSAKKAGPAAR